MPRATHSELASSWVAASPLMLGLSGCRLESETILQIELKHESASILQHRTAAVPLFEHEELVAAPQASTRMCQAEDAIARPRSRLLAGDFNVMRS